MGKKISSQITFMKAIENMSNYVHNNIMVLNQSKIFAGLMIVIINIASKFVTFDVSKTVESYLKFTFSRNVLVFAATWMGTRDIYTAIIMTFGFILVVDILFNEKSIFCCLPETFTNEQVAKLEGMQNQIPTPEDIVKAKIVLEKAKQNDKGQGETQLHDSNKNLLYNNDIAANVSGY